MGKMRVHFPKVRSFGFPRLKDPQPLGRLKGGAIGRMVAV